MLTYSEIELWSTFNRKQFSEYYNKHLSQRTDLYYITLTTKYRVLEAYYYFVWSAKRQQC